MKRLMIIGALLAFALSACGSRATPTTDPAQVQASAVAAASTMVALTQSAVPPTDVPTDTPEPSPTPLPTSTPISLPTLSGSVYPTAVVPSVPTQASSQTTGDPCNAPLGPNPAGQKVTINIQNSSGAQANVSIYLSKTKFGECGYRGYRIAKGNSVAITDLVEGCYFLYAWINDPKKPSTVSGSGCVFNVQKATFTILQSSIHASTQ